MTFPRADFQHGVMFGQAGVPDQAFNGPLAGEKILRYGKGQPLRLFFGHKKYTSFSFVAEN
nr:hypothetical protein [Hydrogeniiclostridium mannosilyticum]